MALPSGGTNYQLKSVSCLSSTWCLTVGTYVSEGNRAIASRWSGSAWNAVGNLTAPSAFPIAYGVSCLTTTQCYAVGTASGKPFADSYVGGEFPWSTMTLSLPAGASGGELRGISCVSTVHCEASGWSLFGGTPTGLIETYS